MNGLCTRLVTLVLDIYSEEPDDLLPLLKDMPVLKNLKLDQCALTIDSLETIHRNIPSLVSLGLTGARLFPSELPENIVPAKLVTRLHIWSYGFDALENTKWLQYLYTKYPNLIHLNCDADEVFCSWEYGAVHGAQYPLLVGPVFPHLQSLGVCASSEKSLVTILMFHGADSQIKNMTLDLENDKIGKRFILLSSMKQFEFIEHLTLRYIPVTEDLKKLQDMRSLKSVHLHFENPSKDSDYSYDSDDSDDSVQNRSARRDTLNDIMRLFPESLESVTISRITTTLDLSQKDEFKVKELTFENVTIHGEWPLDRFISNCFPYLHTLKLMDTFRGNETLMLPEHHMSCIEITHFPRSDYNLSLITKEGISFYSDDLNIDNVYSGCDDLLLPVPKKSLESSSLLVIACPSLKKLVLGSREAFLISNQHEFQTLSKENHFFLFLYIVYPLLCLLNLL